LYWGWQQPSVLFVDLFSLFIYSIYSMATMYQWFWHPGVWHTILETKESSKARFKKTFLDISGRFFPFLFKYAKYGLRNLSFYADIKKSKHDLSKRCTQPSCEKTNFWAICSRSPPKLGFQNITLFFIHLFSLFIYVFFPICTFIKI